MKRLLCTILATLLAIVPAAWISQARAESAGIFQPRLDTDTSCEITVVGSYSSDMSLIVRNDYSVFKRIEVK